MSATQERSSMVKDMSRDHSDDTIVAPSTPIGEGGIGIVRLSGSKALKIADEIFVSKNGNKPSQCQTYTMHYGHIIDRNQQKSRFSGYLEIVYFQNLFILTSNTQKYEITKNYEEILPLLQKAYSA